MLPSGSAASVRRLVGWMCFIGLIVSVLSNTPPVLEITGGSNVVSLVEHREKEEELKVIRCSDAENEHTRVYLSSLTPSNPCGKCFAVTPCDLPFKKKFCLYYFSGLGTLSYSAVSSYRARVTCTDDDDEDDEFIDIRVQDNQAPVFKTPTKGVGSGTVFATEQKREGASLYEVVGKDEEGDAIFYTLSSTDPKSDLFEIGYGDGVIRAAKDMRFLCEDRVRMSVTLADTLHSNVDPGTISLSFRATNQRPTFKPQEPIIRIKENAGLAYGIADLKMEDTNRYSKLRIKMRAEPEVGLEYYELLIQGSTRKVKPRRELDYEYEPIRSVRLIFEATDGFCEAEELSFLVELIDVNEPPQILPAYVEKTVYEGFIEVDPGWVATDPDLDENLEWSMVKPSTAFDVDPLTGWIRSKGEFDIDPRKRDTVRKMSVRVLDKDKLRSIAEIKLTILDRNDNAPSFTQEVKRLTASECTKVGKIIGTLIANDRDSSFQGNDMLVFSGSGQMMSVLATGRVVLTQQCTDGMVETIEAFVSDQGQYPGPLSGVPSTVTVTCGKCPIPEEGTGGNNNNNGNGNGNGGGGGDGDFTGELFANDNDAGDLSGAGLFPLLSWLIPALILATLLLALLAYLIWRGCYALIPAIRRRMLLRRKMKRKVLPQRKIQQLEPKKEEEQVEVVKLTPPEPPPTEPDPRFFGFWKETYIDRDQRHMPTRDTLPMSVAQDHVVHEVEKIEEKEEIEERMASRRKIQEDYRQEYEKYKEEVSQLQNPRPIKREPPPPPPPPPKKKFCAIL